MHAGNGLWSRADGDTGQGSKGSPHRERRRRKCSAGRRRSPGFGANLTAEAKTTEQGSNHSRERKTLVAFHRTVDFARGSLQSAGTISTVTYLLDVNMLIAAIWQDHEDQSKVEAWLGRKTNGDLPN